VLFHQGENLIVREFEHKKPRHFLLEKKSFLCGEWYHEYAGLVSHIWGIYVAFEMDKNSPMLKAMGLR